jgi:DNA-binding transcriptional MerR regulator
MDWSIQQVARHAGTTSRTLRHYDDIGLLPPTRVAPNGYRYYDQHALVRLQRILLLRDLGLGLTEIGGVIENGTEPTNALRSHLQWLRQEQDRIALQIASVENSIDRLEGGEQLMAENMFGGFEHTQYKEEVEERWGADAYASADRWWRSLGEEGRTAFQQRAADLMKDWADAATRGIPADGDEAQALAQRQFGWLSGVPGTPGQASGGPTKEYFVGLGEMYVADERFGANYASTSSAQAADQKNGAEFVRDAMRVYADRNL